VIDLGVTDDERLLISHGLSEYGEPIRGQVVMTRALGLPDLETFDDLVARLRGAIFRKEPLSKLDWARAVFLTEVSRASDLVGAGLDFKTNFHDDEAAPVLRSIQWKLIAWASEEACSFPSKQTDNAKRSAMPGD
jgi:hypothetical protein